MTEPLTAPASGAHRRSTRAVSAAGVSQGMAVLSYLLGGVIVYGGLGWAGSHFLGQIWMLPVGIVLGIGLAVLLISRRFARGDVIDNEVKQMLAERERRQQYWAAEARKPNGS